MDDWDTIQSIPIQSHVQYHGATSIQDGLLYADDDVWSSWHWSRATCYPQHHQHMVTHAPPILNVVKRMYNVHCTSTPISTKSWYNTGCHLLESASQHMCPPSAFTTKAPLAGSLWTNGEFYSVHQIHMLFKINRKHTVPRTICDSTKVLRRTHGTSHQLLQGGWFISLLWVVCILVQLQLHITHRQITHVAHWLTQKSPADPTSLSGRRQVELFRFINASRPGSCFPIKIYALQTLINQWLILWMDLSACYYLVRFPNHYFSWGTWLVIIPKHGLSCIILLHFNNKKCHFWHWSRTQMFLLTASVCAGLGQLMWVIKQRQQREATLSHSMSWHNKQAVWMKK